MYISNWYLGSTNLNNIFLENAVEQLMLGLRLLHRYGYIIRKKIAEHFRMSSP